MTTPSTSKSAATTSAEDAATVLTFEDRLRIFWQKNSRSVVILIVIVLLGVLGKGLWEYMEKQKEQELGREFAAATTPDQLKTFATAHHGHTLAGVARLRIADASYAAGKSAEAIAGYEEALAVLKTGPLASRAKLGLAMARVQAGKTAEGETALKQVASDATEAKGVRVEANYHLASLALTANKPAEVTKYSEEIMKLDPSSPWLQRVFMLRASLPIADVAPATSVSPVTLPAAGK